MFRMKYLAALVIGLGLISLVIGGVFLSLATQKNNYLVNTLRQQKITLGLTQDQIAKGQVVDNAQTAEVAAQTLAKHLASIAPTYSDLMASNPGGKFDPSDPKDLTYAQGLNLENSMNMAVLSFGVVQMTMATGGALIVIGIAVGVLGLALFRMGQKQTNFAMAPVAEASLAAGS